MFFSVRVCACARVHFMYEWHVLRWGPPVIQPEVRLTEQHKKSGGKKKNNILRGLCPTLRYYYRRGWQVREREGERTLLHGGGEEDEITPVLVAD